MVSYYNFVNVTVLNYENFNMFNDSDSLSDCDDALGVNNIVLRNDDVIINASCVPQNNQSIANRIDYGYHNNNRHSFKNGLYNFPHQDTYRHHTLRSVRETSPMSMRSTSTLRSMADIPINFKRRQRNLSPVSLRSAQLNYQRDFTHRSVYNGRSTAGSISDTPTFSSNVTALDVTSAIKMGEFSKREMVMIQKALGAYVGYKCRGCKRGHVHKRSKCPKRSRNLVSRGSSSSMSSEDCRSVRSEMLLHNTNKFNWTGMSYAASEQNFPISHGTARQIQNMTLLSQSIKRGPVFSNPIGKRQGHAFQNMYSFPQNKRLSPEETLNNKLEKFKEPLPIPSAMDKTKTNENVNYKVDMNNYGEMLLIEDDNSSRRTKARTGEIINDVNDSGSDNDNVQDMRYVEKIISHSKVPNLHTEKNRNANEQVVNPNAKPSKMVNDFVFAKPKLPLQIAPAKLHHSRISPHKDLNVRDKENVTQNNVELDQTEPNNCTSDLLTKSSFMRRKLFTQAMEVTENTQNTSSNSLPTNSPIPNIYKSPHLRNKHKSSIISQSCFEHNSDDTQKNKQDNIVELVHKIIHVQDIDLINARKSKSLVNDKTSENTVGTENSDHLSDTFTDEESIFYAKSRLKETNNVPKEKCISKKINSDIGAKSGPGIRLEINSTDKIKNKEKTRTDSNRDRTQEISTHSKMLNISKKDHTNSELGSIIRKARKFWNTDSETEEDVNKSVSQGKQADKLNRSRSRKRNAPSCPTSVQRPKRKTRTPDRYTNTKYETPHKSQKTDQNETEEEVNKNYTSNDGKVTRRTRSSGLDINGSLTNVNKTSMKSNKASKAKYKDNVKKEINKQKPNNDKNQHKENPIKSSSNKNIQNNVASASNCTAEEKCADKQNGSRSRKRKAPFCPTPVQRPKRTTKTPDRYTNYETPLKRRKTDHSSERNSVEKKRNLVNMQKSISNRNYKLGVYQPTVCINRSSFVNRSVNRVMTNNDDIKSVTALSIASSFMSGRSKFFHN